MKKHNYSLLLCLVVIIVFIFIIIHKTPINYVSHTFEPNIGDKVLNNNKNCKHFNSCGVVVDIKDLDQDMGKVIEYKVTNDGATYKKGDTLNKTMDQLCPDKVI